MTQERIMHRLRSANPAPAPAQRSDGDQLFARLIAEPGDARLNQTGPARPTLARADRPRRGRAGGARVGRDDLLRRPRLLAGGTLGLAGIGTALVLILSAGGAAAPPAFAVTSNSDGSLTVNLDSDGGLVGANRKLAAMGIDEHIWFQMAKGAAPASGTVSCASSPQGASVSGPPVQLTVGPGVTNTETIAAGNTGAGVWHVAACWRASGTDTAALPVVNPGQTVDGLRLVRTLSAVRHGHPRRHAHVATGPRANGTDTNSGG